MKTPASNEAGAVTASSGWLISERKARGVDPFYVAMRQRGDGCAQNRRDDREADEVDTDEPRLE